MDCKKVILDNLPTLVQRKLMAEMICQYNFKQIQYVSLWYGSFNQNIYTLMALAILIVVGYMLLFYPLAKKIIVPSFLAIKKRLKVSSVFMSGIIFPVLYNYGLFFGLPEEPKANYLYHPLCLAVLLGSTFILMSLFFGLLSVFSPKQIKMPTYPIYICFSFLALGLTILALNGLFGQTSLFVVPVMIMLYLVFTYAIRWADKKELEEQEKNKRAHEALENFQKMMGVDGDETELEEAKEFERIKQERLEKRKVKVELSVSQQVMEFVFDSENHWLLNAIVSPVMLVMILIIPFKNNPFTNTYIKCLQISVSFFIFIETTLSPVIEFVYRGTMLLVILAVILFFILDNRFHKFTNTVVDFLAIFTIYAIFDTLQEYFDDTIAFTAFYFSLDVIVSAATMISLKLVTMDTVVNILLMMKGEHEALLNCYTSPIFGIFLVWPYFVIRGALENNYGFEIFSYKFDFFEHYWGVSDVSRNYFKFLFGSLFILVIVKFIYYIICQFKLNEYLARTLYTIYFLFFGVSNWYGMAENVYVSND